jgi:hypothetical protein
LGIYWQAENLLASLIHEVRNGYLILSSLKNSTPAAEGNYKLMYFALM